MVSLGDEQKSFCRFWDCIQVLHFRLFCWPWWLLHFFWGIPARSSRYNGHLSSIHPFQSILVRWFLECRRSLLPSLFWPLPICLDSWTWHSRFLCNTALYSIRLCFYHQSHPQLGIVFALAPSLHSFWSLSRVYLFVTPWTVARQAPLSIEFWNGLPFPSPGESSEHRDQTQVSCIAGRHFNL